MKRELGERVRRGESSRKTRRRKRSGEDYDDEVSNYKVKRNLSLSSSYLLRSPPESEAKELKSLLLRFDSDCRSNYIHWYHINNNNNTHTNITTTTTTTTTNTTMVSPIRTIPPSSRIITTTTTTTNTTMVTNLSPICTIPPSSRIGRGCASALFESKLFIFGGSPSTIDCEQCIIGCSDVFSIDFNANNVGDQNTQVVWRKENFEMLAKRCRPAAAATHGKIFIFGSNKCETLPKPWAEVFDPNLNLFSPLPEPPLYVTQAYGCIGITVVANGDTILLCMNNTTLFSFNVITKSWGQLSTSPHLTRGWSYRSATLDDVHFTYSVGCVQAYDLIRQKWFKKPVLDVATMSDIPPFYLIHGHVVHVGNNTLCVVWLNELQWMPTRSVGCMNFQVVREINSKGKHFLRAQVHSGTDYLIPTGHYFDDCLAL